jgi:hypothetical protein
VPEQQRQLARVDRDLKGDAGVITVQRLPGRVHRVPRVEASAPAHNGAADSEAPLRGDRHRTARHRGEPNGLRCHHMVLSVVTYVLGGVVLDVADELAPLDIGTPGSALLSASAR